MDSPILQQSSDSSLTSFSTSSNDGFFGSLKNINITTWIIIIFILAFLGINVFSYLAQGTQSISEIFRPLIKLIFGTTISVTDQVVDVSAEGAKVVVGETADILEGGLTAIQNLPNGNISHSSIKGQPIHTQQPDVIEQTPLNKALQNSPPQDLQAYEPESKTGWCYIGEDRGFRTCAQVGVNDTCMSGEIFPTNEICMNPNLRA